LKNKLDIRDSEKLAEAERRITALNILEIIDFPVKGNFDLKHLQAIHKRIFQEIYSWAGALRTVNISKGNAFCMSEHIVSFADDLFGKLSKERYLIEAGKNTIPERLAFYLGEINVLHPFREGNGRAQRVFIEYLAESLGYHLDFSQVTDNEMIEASALAFAQDYSKMIEMFNRIASLASETRLNL
jgi:cell filamentation protein